MNDTTPTPNPAPETPTFERGKRLAMLFSLILIGAMLWPIQENWRSNPHDDFPLTYYPMFSAKREPIETFYYVVGRDAQGKRHYIPHTMMGTGGLNQVRKQLNRKVREGRAGEVVQVIVAKLAKRTTSPWADIVTVDVCRGKYVVDDYFHGKKEPVFEEVKASSPVGRKTL